MRSKILVLSPVVLSAMMVFTVNVFAVVYTVTNTNDSGNGSLRWAIEQANTNPYLDDIEFNIPGPGPHTIQPDSALPVIFDPLVIDGYTQLGAVQNTNPVGMGLNTVLKIELDGSKAGTASGLWIVTTDCNIRGLVINRFSGSGIYMSADDTEIYGNFIGADASGHAPLGNAVGVTILAGRNNYIGTSQPEGRNLISGNALDGITLGGGSYTLVGNFIWGNLIGTDVSGNNAMGNGRYGIFLAATAESTTVGGTATQGNGIAFNGDNGICVPLGTSNAILGNSIHSNGRLGIDLNRDAVTPNDSGDVDTGPNNLQNFPVLSTATPTVFTGNLNSISNSAYRLEFFASTVCDPSNYGEGEMFLGDMVVWTDGTGTAGFTYTTPKRVQVGQLITATATDMSDNTSEFSNCVEVTVCCACADCNADGVVNILDALLEVNCILGKIPQPCSCDCSQDGSDNILDVLCIVNYILWGVCP